MERDGYFGHPHRPGRGKSIFYKFLESVGTSFAKRLQTRFTSFPTQRFERFKYLKGDSCFIEGDLVSTPFGNKCATVQYKVSLGDSVKYHHTEFSRHFCKIFLSLSFLSAIYSTLKRKKFLGRRTQDGVLQRKSTNFAPTVLGKLAYMARICQIYLGKPCFKKLGESKLVSWRNQANRKPFH